MNKNWNEIFWKTFESTLGIIGKRIKGASERSEFIDRIAIAIARAISDSYHFKTLWIIERFDEQGRDLGRSLIHGNLALNEGLNTINTLICGGSATAYTNANAQIGVGDSNAAEDATQTDLQAAINKTWLGMDSGYPIYGSSQKIIFKTTFGPSDANYDWEEFSIRNGAGADKNLNRKISSEGTKTSGKTWIVTSTLTGA